MDRSYMLNSYASENEENLSQKEDASTLLDKLEFRMKGTKSIEELKKEVSIFLEQNTVPTDIKEEIERTISEFNDNADVYTVSNRLENILSSYLETSENNYKQSNDTLYEVKEELVSSSLKDLEDIGITTTGNPDEIIDKIETESDVIKLKENIETTVDYFNQRNDAIHSDEPVSIELSTSDINDSLENAGTNSVLETSLEEQEHALTTSVTNIEVTDEGSVVVNGDSKNQESINFTAMMTAALVTSNSDFGIEEPLDMKFIKNPDQDSTYKAIYGNFPLINHPENKLDPILVDKIQTIAKNYNPNVSYTDLLTTLSPEVSTSLNIIHNHVLNEQGAFQMALKNGDNQHEIMFAMDENFSNISSSFRESGAMVSSDAMENDIVRVNNTVEGEQLMILNTTLESLNQKKKEKLQAELLQNTYQKKLIYENTNQEAANTFNIFLITLVSTEVIILLIGLLVMFIQ